MIKRSRFSEEQIIAMMRRGDDGRARAMHRPGTIRAAASWLPMLHEHDDAGGPRTLGGARGAAGQRPFQGIGRLRCLLWLGGLALAGVTLWLIGPVTTPFIVGALISYFLNPLVCRLESQGIPRSAASAVLVILMMVLILAALVGFVPIVTLEVASLIQSIPDLYASAQEAIAEMFPAISRYEANNALDGLVNRIGEKLADSDAAMFGVMSGFGSIAQVIIFWAVMPVVAFYLLLDWRRLLNGIEGLIPRANLHTVRRLARDIDLVLAGYVRGTTTVCLILAAYYAVLLGMMGLSYGVLVGIVAGLISFIPYVGAFIGGALAIGIALSQFWGEPIFVALVAAIFLFGQFLESQILVPRLVGASVNVHPVWLIFAIIALGYLFGFMGALAAVPVAASLGVLTRASFAAYTRSDVYTETGTPKSRDTDGAQVP